MGKESRRRTISKNKGRTKTKPTTKPEPIKPEPTPIEPTTKPEPIKPEPPPIEPPPIKPDISPEASDTEFEVPEGPDDESLESLQSITPIMKSKPLHKKLEPEPKTEEPKTEEPKTEEPAAEELQAEEPAAEELQAEEPAAGEPATEEPAAEEPAAGEVVPKEDAKIITYKDIFKTINDFYEQNKGIEETFTELNSVINNMTDKMFDETFETIAEGIFNTTINGKKVFNTLEDAKKFIYEIRHNGRKGFRGQNVLKYKLPKKLQEGLRQEKQEKQQLTPMMIRNIKQIPSSKYIYQY